jgi:hypothetical protein
MEDGTMVRRSAVALALRLIGATEILLEAPELAASRNSVMEYRIDAHSKEVSDAPGAELLWPGDRGFHLFHASRHRGMIEALRRVLAIKGTATV